MKQERFNLSWNFIKQPSTSTGTILKKGDQETKEVKCSHESIWGWSLASLNWVRNTLKITSFRIVQIDQDIVMIISMKKGRWSWVLKLSKMKQGSSELGTVSCREDQHAIEKATGPHLHLNGREHKCTLADAYVAFWWGLLCWVDPLKEARWTFLWPIRCV